MILVGYDVSLQPPGLTRANWLVLPCLLGFLTGFYFGCLLSACFHSLLSFAIAHLRKTPWISTVSFLTILGLLYMHRELAGLVYIHIIIYIHCKWLKTRCKIYEAEQIQNNIELPWLKLIGTHIVNRIYEECFTVVFSSPGCLFVHTHTKI